MRKMIGNQNREGRRNAQVFVSGSTIHMEVLELKISPGKGSFMQKGDSSGVLCWSRNTEVHLLCRALRRRFVNPLQVLLPCAGNGAPGAALHRSHVEGRDLSWFIEL